jgi:adenine phosphoribosyltransferase
VTQNDINSIRQAIRDIPDFPKPGIVFRDITPLLGNGPLFAKTIDVLAERYRDQKIDTVLGIESRGFIVGAALAYKLGAGFCVVRKPGKLPYDTHSASYELEYGTDSLEIHIDAIVECAFVIELSFLKGRDKLRPFSVFSIVQYDAE